MGTRKVLPAHFSGSLDEATSIFLVGGEVFEPVFLILLCGLFAHDEQQNRTEHQRNLIGTLPPTPAPRGFSAVPCLLPPARAVPPSVRPDRLRVAVHVSTMRFLAQRCRFSRSAFQADNIYDVQALQAQRRSDVSLRDAQRVRKAAKHLTHAEMQEPSVLCPDVHTPLGWSDGATARYLKETFQNRVKTVKEPPRALRVEISRTVASLYAKDCSIGPMALSTAMTYMARLGLTKQAFREFAKYRDGLFGLDESVVTALTFTAARTGSYETINRVLDYIEGEGGSPPHECVEHDSAVRCCAKCQRQNPNGSGGRLHRTHEAQRREGGHRHLQHIVASVSAEGLRENLRLVAGRPGCWYRPASTCERHTTKAGSENL